MKNGRVLFPAMMVSVLLMAGCCTGYKRGGRGVPAAPDNQSASQLSIFLKNHAVSISGIDLAQDDFSDLKAFGDSVGNTRIVALGEQSHGEGNVFALKARLVRYLHEKKGFNVLVWESGMFDGAKIWENAQAGVPVNTGAQGSLFFMYSRAQQVKPLFQYLDSQKDSSAPLVMTALDTPHAGAKSSQLLLPGLVHFIEKHGLSAITADKDWEGFKSVAASVIALKSPSSGTQTKAFEHIIASLRTALATVEGDTYSFPDSAGFWLQIVKSIDAQYQTITGSNPNARDLQMADNVTFLADKMFAGQKLIIWAHNGHALPIQPAMGASLKRTYNSGIYTVLFTGSTGAFLSFDTLQPVEMTPPPPNSWESAWSRPGVKLSFLDVRGSMSNPEAKSFFASSLSLRLFGYQDGQFSGAMFGGLNSVADGIFYLDQIQPVVMQ